MIAANLIFVIVFVLGFIYVLMGLAAYSHTLKEDKSAKSLAISPWWAVNTSIYDNFGRKLAWYGKVILAVNGILCAIWLYIK
ncbi:MAG: hypothetical protein N0C88_11545 [Candidatus Thiodiazotropha lotti]|uniref:Uncharacterized protein n=1 Tax=Candidatus Thiodiazotropha lotti TaxID=2792787 RepID=A0A9E4MZF7_9GAMM|nr:hypothetical protein [Candidatus Thiodiazotropha endoloripes]MCG7905007.1 hypothetical protein [Candidatus Thiodiazotropha taylori]MCG7939467.1 hypothetical protein [Candidatus Thiodiazotropha lotti]MCG8002260.1 hypothetical protein [Candidatus Thiodiazotropha lotti]MCW4185879.1 hypothetical protein [Candidatus Thiodiazotropha lotti]MCW4203940.1 hypothetical protein [Candidatus Thiodiazotropha lotti]